MRHTERDRAKRELAVVAIDDSYHMPMTHPVISLSPLSEFIFVFYHHYEKTWFIM